MSGPSDEWSLVIKEIALSQRDIAKSHEGVANIVKDLADLIAMQRQQITNLTNELGRTNQRIDSLAKAIAAPNDNKKQS